MSPSRPSPRAAAVKSRYADRELSWLSFNARVLQEAADPSVPLLERVKFLAIYSSNLDEFFRVRVARLRSVADAASVEEGGSPSGDGAGPAKAESAAARRLWEIRRMVAAQQERFGRIYRQGILPDLARHGLHILDDRTAGPEAVAHARRYFAEHVRPHVEPLVLSPDEPAGEGPPFLENNALYLVATLWPRRAPAAHPHYALVRVPAPPLHRFVEVPCDDGRAFLMLDDVVRLGLPDLLPDYEVGAAYAVKLSRDAELYLGDETEGDLVAKIRERLARRKTGLPCRFLYDLAMPFPLTAFLKARLALQDEDMVLGGRYHNFSDLFGFPPPEGEVQAVHDGLHFEPFPPLDHPALETAPSLLDAIRAQDHLLHFPYQRYDYVLRFLDEAARDEAVEALWITLYRVAPDSGVTRALLEAARRGKRVTAFVEVKARFDEAPNLKWAARLEEAGVQVLYSMPDIKVHAKVALVLRREGDGPRLYAYLGTGNFNERTARIYADHALLTADPRLTHEVRALFGYLCGETEAPRFEHLLIAPFRLRDEVYRLIDAEIAHARAGRRGALVAKMNALEDEGVIDRLYRAVEAGVDVRLVVRGICRLVPEEDEAGGRPLITSIVGRFLEHARVYRFHDGGRDHLYLASADWMKRNLSRRIEVAFPLYDDRLRRELDDVLDLQLRDNVKARRLDAAQRNAYHRPDGPPVDAQAETYRLLEARLAAARAAAAARATSDTEVEAVREGVEE